MGATAELAAFVAVGANMSLPESIIRATQDVVLDSIGCALAGHALELGRLSAAYANRQAGNATVIGSPLRSTPEGAIFANSQLMNALDLEEVLMNWGHQIPFILPVALAVAEERGSSGIDLLRAIAVGYEVAARVSAALAGPVRVVGTPPELKMEALPSFGYSSNIFGSVACAATLMRLDQRQIEHAFGTAAFMASVPCASRFASGPDVPMAKYGIMGSVAQAGYTAAVLAASGFTAYTTLLDGPDGFARFVGSPRFDVEGLVAGLGETWWIGKMSLKPYPNCRMNHLAMDVLARLMREHAIAPESIKRIRAKVWPRVVNSPVFRCPDPKTPTDAQFSIPYALAAIAYRRGAFPDLQSEDTLRDPAILALARRVEIEPEQRLTEARFQRHGSEPIGPIDLAPTEVQVETDTGTYTGYAETGLGDSFAEGMGMPAAIVQDKFRVCARTVLQDEAIDRLCSALSDLGKVTDLREVLGLLTPKGPPSPQRPYT